MMLIVPYILIEIIRTNSIIKLDYQSNTKNLLNDHINISPKNVIQFKSNQHTKYFA